MKNLILLFLFFVFYNISDAQDLIVNKKINSGIYKNLNELKNNNPSQEFNHEISTSIRGSIKDKKNEPVIFYNINFNKSKERLKDEIFGFCDGRHIYINEYYPQLYPRARFLKLTLFGKYGYYVNQQCKNIHSEYTSRVKCKTVYNVIDLESGKLIYLNKESIKEIIADDIELLNEFNKESKKNKKIKDYMVRYIERNTNSTI